MFASANSSGSGESERCWNCATSTFSSTVISGKEPDVLERARQAEPADLVRRAPGDVAALEQDRAAVGPVDAAQAIEESRLARAVGADDADDAVRARRAGRRSARPSGRRRSCSGRGFRAAASWVEHLRFAAAAAEQALRPVEHHEHHHRAEEEQAVIGKMLERIAQERRARSR